ncbi:hypothetical protein GUJ93_ZPchr0040g33518 [Zizania palustris]|uniref:Uncharacterized protein n=1 Tax=Zizania palustris TaxID=103762 RepID=A0A8J5RSY4_ZIZPA|nr:hypothetical protein GUJ93_ZPchr0040g33518 [Zizania palustris]
MIDHLHLEMQMQYWDSAHQTLDTYTHAQCTRGSGCEGKTAVSRGVRGNRGTIYACNNHGTMQAIMSHVGSRFEHCSFLILLKPFPQQFCRSVVLLCEMLASPGNKMFCRECNESS